ncbi:hypothetical protein TDB9533_04342 [Thalassocella blandensis]|nr:hypothetical protein TDB9533_04342 [Thalassocella blandensis]
MAELKFVVTGTPGVGKSTALNSVCDSLPIATEATTSDDLSAVKETTTVALDFGEVLLDDGTCLRIYGTPGQIRFKHMWEIISEGALGFIILIDATRKDPVEDLSIYIENFQPYISQTSAVVAITRDPDCSLEPYYNYLESNGLCFPVMCADPRDRDDMTEVLMALIAMLEFSN